MNHFALTFSPAVALLVALTGAASEQINDARLEKAYGQLPLSFEANRGQAGESVRFLARGVGYTLFLTDDEAALVLRAPRQRGSSNDRQSGQKIFAQLQLIWIGANRSPKITGADVSPGKVNYFFGNNPTRWQTDLPVFGKVKYAAVYPGIDLVYYGNQRQLEFDWVVAPGANPRDIRLGCAGADWLEVDARGDLVAHLDRDEIRFHKPYAYQEQKSERREVPARYILRSADPQGQTGRSQRRGSSGNLNEVSFELAAYDTARPLIIDPVLVYSTYLGGTDQEDANGIAVDAAGNAYVTGYTDSTNFPTAKAFQARFVGELYVGDIFVTKFNPAGSALIYSTYLGGNSVENFPRIAIDSATNVYLTGYTTSTNFPTKTPLQSALKGNYDAFVTKLNASGSALVYSTYLGGSSVEYGTGITVDRAGSAYVCGYTASTNFPTKAPLQPVLQGAHDVFLTKLNAAGSALVYSTYLGGANDDLAFGVALDSQTNAFLVGTTFSTNFPTVNAIQTAGENHGSKVFVTKIAASGATLLYSTYLGGSGVEVGYGIAVDVAGNAYVTGNTSSTNYPVTADCIQSVSGGDRDIFITKLNPTGSALVYSTYLGGVGRDEGTQIAIDSAGNAYITGATASTNFPTSNALQGQNSGGLADAYVAVLNANASALLFSTYLGGNGSTNRDDAKGIALDAAGNIYLTGRTTSYADLASGHEGFPVTNAFQSVFRGNGDAFVLKIKDVLAPVLGVRRLDNHRVEIFWPISGTNFVLQTTESLSPVDWLNTTNARSVSGTRISVTNDTLNPMRLYRLAR
jgi:hypothetical protein